MNKKCIGLLLAVPALMGFGLTSCSNEEPMFTKEESATKQVEVSLIAEIGNLSRASLTFDEAKNLKFKWANEDVIYAVNADNGKLLGRLTVAKVLEDPRNCEFKGTLNLPTLGSANLKFYYLGEKGELELDSETKQLKDIEVDFSAQTGTAAELDDYDLLKAEKEYQSTDNGKLGRLSFERHFSTGQFVLKYNGEELNLTGKTVNISAASGTLYNKASLNYKSGVYTHYEGEVSVTPSTNNFYINIIPTESVQFKFTVDMGDGNVFEGVKGGTIKEDTYYSDNLDAIVVEMTNTDPAKNEQEFILYYAPNYTPTSEGNKEYNKKRVGSADFKVQTYDLFTREEYVLVGWNTEADGTGTAYAVGETLTITYPQTTATLYAQWEKKTIDYKITLLDEDGTTVIDTLGNPSSEPTQTVVLPTGATKENKSFNGWKVIGAENGTETKGPWTLTAENPQVTLVAVYQWVWTVTFMDEVTGERIGNPKKTWSYNSSKYFDKTFEAKPTHEGYTFLGWFYNDKQVYDTMNTFELTSEDFNPVVWAKFKKDASSGNITAPGAGGSNY